MKKEKNFNKGEIIIYKAKDGPKLDVRLNMNTVWLNLNQIADLFDTDKSGISRHIKNIYQTGELKENSTVAKIATVQSEGGRKITRDIEYYNLDIIISVGYRVNFVQFFLRDINLSYANLSGTKFRAAHLCGANFFGAILNGTELDDIIIDRRTRGLPSKLSFKK